MEPHIHRHGMYGRCRWDRTVRVAPFELSPHRTTANEAVQGVVVITNRNVRLPPPFDWVWVCGLDDPVCGIPDGEAAVAGAEGCRIVLMHSPSGLLALRNRRFDLALCGHTHGGQIALPNGTPIYLPRGPLTRKYSRGRFELPDGGTLLVTTGVGFTGVPIRVFADPEILLCHITAAADD